MGHSVLKIFKIYNYNSIANKMVKFVNNSIKFILKFFNFNFKHHIIFNINIYTKKDIKFNGKTS